MGMSIDEGLSKIQVKSFMIASRIGLDKERSGEGSFTITREHSKKLHFNKKVVDIQQQ